MRFPWLRGRRVSNPGTITKLTNSGAITGGGASSVSGNATGGAGVLRACQELTALTSEATEGAIV